MYGCLFEGISRTAQWMAMKFDTDVRRSLKKPINYILSFNLNSAQMKSRAKSS